MQYFILILVPVIFFLCVYYIDKWLNAEEEDNPILAKQQKQSQEQLRQRQVERETMERENKQRILERTAEALERSGVTPLLTSMFALSDITIKRDVEFFGSYQRGRKFHLFFKVDNRLLKILSSDLHMARTDATRPYLRPERLGDHNRDRRASTIDMLINRTIDAQDYYIEHYMSGGSNAVDTRFYIDVVGDEAGILMDTGYTADDFNMVDYLRSVSTSWTIMINNIRHRIVEWDRVKRQKAAWETKHLHYLEDRPEIKEVFAPLGLLYPDKYEYTELGPGSTNSYSTVAFKATVQIGNSLDDNMSQLYEHVATIRQRIDQINSDYEISINTDNGSLTILCIDRVDKVEQRDIETVCAEINSMGALTFNTHN